MNWCKDISRGWGRTTAQMAAAPHGAVFVWVGPDTYYPRRLAQKIGRGDLKIVGPDWLRGNWRGTKLTGLVIDHAVKLTPEQLDHAACALTRVQGDQTRGVI